MSLGYMSLITHLLHKQFRFLSNNLTPQIQLIKLLIYLLQSIFGVLLVFVYNAGMTKKVSYLVNVLAGRIKSIRLKKNITQKELSELTGLSINAIQGAERGECRLETFVAIMAALDQAALIENLIPEQLPSPLRITSHGAGKVRARKKRGHSHEDVDW